MLLPEIDDRNRGKPLCYDPQRNKFIAFDEIVSGQERILPPDQLSEDDLKKLVIERLASGPDFSVQVMSGPPMSRDDVIVAVEQDESFGQLTLEAEKSYLRSILSDIQEALDTI